MGLTKHDILVSTLITFLLTACTTHKTQANQADASQTINSRAVIHRDSGMYQDIRQISNGEASFELCIDPEGKVINVEIDKRNSSITDLKILEKMKASLSKYRYDPSLSAEPQECGTYKLIVETTNRFN